MPTKTTNEPLKIDMDVPPATLASAIVKISEAAEALRRSGLNRRAIVVLLKDSTGVPKSKIDRVFSGLESLRKEYCS